MRRYLNACDRPGAVRLVHVLGSFDYHGARSKPPIRDTSCRCHPLTGVPHLRPGPRRAFLCGHEPAWPVAAALAQPPAGQGTLLARLRRAAAGHGGGGKTLSLPCVSAAFVAKDTAFPCGLAGRRRERNGAGGGGLPEQPEQPEFGAERKTCHQLSPPLPFVCVRSPPFCPVCVVTAFHCLTRRADR